MKLSALAGVLRLPELRRRVAFTLALLTVYRIGSRIPTPGVDTQALQQQFAQTAGTALDLINLFSGGQFERLSIFALGVMPYITASIILQLATTGVPALKRIQEEGELGRRKITQWTRYLTIVLAVLQSAVIAVGIEQGGLVYEAGVAFIAMTVITLTAGTAFVMWMGEQITHRGIGNGISLLIFTSIVSGIPAAGFNLYENVFVTRQWSLPLLFLILTVMAAVVAVVVLVERAERRVPVQYARRFRGRREQGGMATYLPLKVNATGVIPVIFASSMLMILPTLAWLAGGSGSGLSFLDHFSPGRPLYLLLSAGGIMLFCFVYVSMIFHPNDVADNLRRQGGFVPGIRSGKPTADYLERILTRLTTIGAVYLAALCIIPDVMISGAPLHHLPWVGEWFDANLPRVVLDGLSVNFYFGGTSLLIVIGVAMDTVKQIESQLTLRHYEELSAPSRSARRRWAA